MSVFRGAGGGGGKLIDGSGNPLDLSASTVHRLASSAASENATVVKPAAGALNSIHVENTNAARRYLKLYNKATAPTAADTPLFVIPLPPSTVLALEPAAGWNFTIGISYRIVTGTGDADATAPGAGEIQHLALGYK